MSAYDVIVVGLGTHGSATVAELARRGARVLGIERFARGHEMGSFVGRSRVIRTAYFEHPDYVPLLRRAWDRWLELERETGERILFPTGGLYAGAPGSAIVEGSLRSVREHGLAHEVLEGDALRRRHPWFRGDDLVAIVEERAGYLVPERAIAAHLAVAERHGAELRFADGADDWYPDPDGSAVNVHTAAGRSERGGSLVLTAGAWLPYFLPDLALPLQVERVPLFWYEPARPDAFREMPVYVIETDDGSYYGFPYMDGQGLKVARHGTGDITEPDRLHREMVAGEDEGVRRFIGRYLPAGKGPLRASKVCMYTKTPDEHFIVDRHPTYPRVVFASACSGHGFKFASVMGEVLADLALNGSTALPIAFLSLARFATGS
ncbi:MAG TPA: N-methyl-L-tryptophan oxidase [Candidatus Limnocylindria bacterium]